MPLTHKYMTAHFTVLIQALRWKVDALSVEICSGNDMENLTMDHCGYRVWITTLVCIHYKQLFISVLHSFILFQWLFSVFSGYSFHSLFFDNL